MAGSSARGWSALDGTHSDRKIPEIEALRGLSIILVIGYHYMPGRLPGGFVGVDVFFVISGFLITEVLIAALETNRFSYSDFYRKRIRRLFPALATVLVCALAAGYLILLSDEYEQLGKHIFAGSVFGSNFVLWSESGYFDNSALTKPLIHLWSLSIEEQFYLLFPLVLSLAWSRGARVMSLVIGILGLGSFGLNLLLVGSHPAAAYYLPLTRIWELMLGAWLTTTTRASAVTPGARLATIPADLAAVAGIAMILLSSVLLNGRSAYPGWLALAPTVGTCAVIGSVVLSKRSFALLRFRPLIILGLISYPLYLWHWVLISFVHILIGEVIAVGVKVLLLSIAIALSWLTFTFVETPIRAHGAFGRPLQAVMAGMTAAGVAGLLVFLGHGLPGRAAATPPVLHPGDLGNTDFFQAIRDNGSPCRPEDIRDDARCVQSSMSSRPDLAIVGDSHAEQLFIGLSQALENRNVVSYTRFGVPLADSDAYRGIFEMVLADRDIRTVVLTAFWGMHGGAPVDQLSQTVHALIERGKQVYLLDDIPVYPFSPRGCEFKRLFVPSKCDEDRTVNLQRRQGVYRQLEQVVRENPDAVLVPTTDYFCPGSVCSMLDGDRLLYRDTNHLNVRGSQLLARRLLAQFPSIAE